jgi:hypothetical protein
MDVERGQQRGTGLAGTVNGDPGYPGGGDAAIEAAVEVARLDGRAAPSRGILPNIVQWRGWVFGRLQAPVVNDSVTTTSTLAETATVRARRPFTARSWSGQEDFVVDRVNEFSAGLKQSRPRFEHGGNSVGDGSE